MKKKELADFTVVNMLTSAIFRYFYRQKNRPHAPFNHNNNNNTTVVISQKFSSARILKKKERKSAAIWLSRRLQLAEDHMISVETAGSQTVCACVCVCVSHLILLSPQWDILHKKVHRLQKSNRLFQNKTRRPLFLLLPLLRTSFTLSVNFAV